MNSQQKFDTRMIEQNKRRGLLPEKDLKAHLQSLPDEAQHAETVAIWDDQLTLPSQKIRYQRELAGHHTDMAPEKANGAGRSEEEEN